MSEHESAKAQAKEKMLEALFEYAAACHVEDIIKENPIEEDAPGFSPSPEFDRKMQKLIARHNRKETLQNIRKKTARFLPKAAIFLLVLLGTLSVAVASVEALRVKVFNFMLDVQKEYTNIKLKESNPDKISLQTIPPDWNGYVPTYIPEGFAIAKTERDAVEKTIIFTNGSGQTIRFTQFLNSKTDLRIDTENASVENISTNHGEALLVEKQGLVSIVWKDESLFYLTGEADKAEIIKMAESIKKY